jgi:hypothetical protein
LPQSKKKPSDTIQHDGPPLVLGLRALTEHPSLVGSVRGLLLFADMIFLLTILGCAIVLGIGGLFGKFRKDNPQSKIPQNE